MSGEKDTPAERRRARDEELLAKLDRVLGPEGDDGDFLTLDVITLTPIDEEVIEHYTSWVTAIVQQMWTSGHPEEAEMAIDIAIALSQFLLFERCTAVGDLQHVHPPEDTIDEFNSWVDAVGANDWSEDTRHNHPRIKPVINFTNSLAKMFAVARHMVMYGVIRGDNA